MMGIALGSKMPVRWMATLFAASLGASIAAAQTAAGGSVPDSAYRAGNGVSKPELLSKVEPSYTEHARKLGVQGTVVLSIVVNADGTAHDIRVMRSVGFGLDQKAIEAVSQWRFAPGVRLGEPVRVSATVEVNFALISGKGQFPWHTGLEFPAVPGRTAPQAIEGTFPKPAKQPVNQGAILEFTVGSNGRVTDIRTILGTPEMVALLQPHLESWRFEPALQGGVPAPATGRIAFYNGTVDKAVLGRLYPVANPPTAAAPRASLPSSVRTMDNPKDGLQYVWIPPGIFTMGCPESDTECAADERPQTEKRLTTGFWMAKTPVTQAAFRKVSGADPSKAKGSDLPVESVTWNDAFSYCAAIGGRLPTEAEWEYAARAGVNGSRYGALSSIAWYRENSGGETHPVGQKQPNAFGLYDMLGNVGEWVEDAYPGMAQRIVRGGSARKPAEDARASRRDKYDPSSSYPDVGFRCVIDHAPSAASNAPATPTGDFIPPKLLRRVEPGYTDAARNARVRGVVVVEAVVSDAGVVTEVKVLTSLGYGLDEKAIEAVKQWKFDPARRDGRPVSASLKAEVAFRTY
jgi:TonB family protein